MTKRQATKILRSNGVNTRGATYKQVTKHKIERMHVRLPSGLRYTVQPNGRVFHGWI